MACRLNGVKSFCKSVMAYYMYVNRLLVLSNIREMWTKQQVSYN